MPVIRHVSVVRITIERLGSRLGIFIDCSNEADADALGVDFARQMDEGKIVIEREDMKVPGGRLN